LQPVIDLGLALKALDVPNLGPCIMGFDLPIAFGNPFYFENDTLFSHEAEYEPSGLGRKPKKASLIQIDHYPQTTPIDKAKHQRR
jgi:hypothetical protein